jgi:hypothetical protein
MVRDIKEGRSIVEAFVIDTKPDRRACRVRLQTGEHFGESRSPGEYELLEFVTPGEAPSFLARVWAEPMFA